MQLPKHFLWLFFSYMTCHGCCSWDLKITFSSAVSRGISCYLHTLSSVHASAKCLCVIVCQLVLLLETFPPPSTKSNLTPNLNGRFLLVKLYRMVPLKRMGSWRMMDKRDLRVCRGSLAMSMLSITILPVTRRAWTNTDESINQKMLTFILFEWF